jgi:hypothetical protein
MKLTRLAILYVLAACGGNQRTEPASSPPTVGRVEVVPAARVPTFVPRLRTEGGSCAVAGMLVCPDGEVDACHRVPPSMNFHVCVPE